MWLQRVVKCALLSLAIVLATRVNGEDILPSTSYFTGAMLVTLHGQKGVQKEISLEQAQYDQIRTLVSTHQQSRVDSFRHVRESGLKGDESARYLAEAAETQAVATATKLRTILQPEQYKRLQQITFHKQLRYQGVLFLQLDSIVKTLELSDEELSQWKMFLREQHERYRSELRELGEQARLNRGAFLTQEQQQRFEELFGEPFQGADLSLPDADHVTPWGPYLELLRNVRVRHDLEIVDDQLDKVEELLRKIESRYDTARRTSIRNRKEGNARDVFKAEVAAMRLIGIPELKEILVPHQIRRLEQLVFQTRARQQSGEPLRSELVASALQLSESQRIAILKSLDEQRAKAKAAANGIWNDTLKSSLEFVSAEKRARYYRLVGRPPEPLD